MATKRTTKKRAPKGARKPNGTPAPIWTDAPKLEGIPGDPGQHWIGPEGCRHLAPHDVARLELALANIQAAKMAAETRDLQAVIAETELRAKVRKLRGAAEGYRAQAKQYEQDYETIRDKLGAKYSVDWTQTGYDDTSGKLTDLP
jgi:hypothetical protein